MIADTMRTGYAEWSDSAFRKWWNGLVGEDNPKVYNGNQRLTFVPDSGHGTLVKGDISAFYQFCEFGKEGEDWLRISPTLYSLCNRGRWSLYRYEAEKSVDEDALWNLNPDVPKYDTIGPMWRLISDTAAGHWNPASAMQVYEVRKADPYFTFKTKPGEKKTLYLDWKHYAWLNSNKKPLKLAVWRAEVDK